MVVVIIAVLALLAIPMMRGAKDDRATFDYARQMAQMIHRARTRAMARGAAHLAIFDATGGGRGRLLLFEAHDADGDFAKKCNTQYSGAVNQWDEVPAWASGVVGTYAKIVEGTDLNVGGINDDANIFARASVGGGALLGGSAPLAVAYCVTPGGATYVGSASTVALGIAAMQGSSTFTATAELVVARHTLGSTMSVGLERHVLLAAGANPRIISVAAP